MDLADLADLANLADLVDLADFKGDSQHPVAIAMLERAAG